MIGEANLVIGASAAEHALTNLGGARLRSHGAENEAQVQFILSRPLNDRYRRRAAVGTLKRHLIFDYALDGAGVAS